MKALPYVALILAGLGLAGGCGRNRLHPSYGHMYRTVMAAQSAERNPRALLPLQGDEAKRIIRAYYDSLAVEDGKAGGGSAGGGGGPSPGGAGAAPVNPFAFKVR